MDRIEEKAKLKVILEADVIATLPQSLADIITQNKEVAEVRIASEQNIEGIAGTIQQSDRLKDQMQDWSLVTLHFKNTNLQQTYLLGDKSNGRGPRITSGIKAIDIEHKLALTSSGSLYSLGIPRIGEPSKYQLMMVCVALHGLGIGLGLGLGVQVF
jgi:hypothetical protein